jgi:hypothetical protein
MGGGNSRRQNGQQPARVEQRAQARLPRPRRLFRQIRRSVSPTTQTIVPASTRRHYLRQTAYLMDPSNRVNSSYLPIGPFLPMQYDYFGRPMYMPNRSMMMFSQRMPTPAPGSYVMSPSALPPPLVPPPPPILSPAAPSLLPLPAPNMPMPSPYVQPAMMGNYTIRPSAPPSVPIVYPTTYPTANGRLITDWTGGGQISPGFLGPPL